jgi:anti-sigma B factor antagonist
VSQPFTAEREDHDGAITIVLTGELDMATVPAAEEQLRRAERDGRMIVIDLRALAFMDSMGLSTIMAADRRIRVVGGRLTILHGPRPVQRVFEITRTDDLLNIVDPPASVSAPRDEAPQRRASTGSPRQAAQLATALPLGSG